MPTGRIMGIVDGCFVVGFLSGVKIIRFHILRRDVEPQGRTGSAVILPDACIRRYLPAIDLGEVNLAIREPIEIPDKMAERVLQRKPRVVK